MDTANRVKFFYVLFAFSIAIVVLSSVAISVVMFYRFNLTMSKQNDDFIRNTTAQLESGIQKLIDNCETISGNLYSNLALQTFLKGRHDRKIDYALFEKFNTITGTFDSILSNNQEIRSISIYKLDPGLVSNGKEIKLVSQFDRPELLQQAIDAQGANVWTSYRDEESGAFNIVLMKYLNVYMPGGVLVIEVNEQSFYELYKSGMASNYLFLMDAGGLVISSNDREAIGKPVSPALDKLIEGRTVTGKLMYDQLPYYMYSINVNATADWSLAVLYDSNEVEKERRNITYYMIFITGMLILVSMLLALLFSKRFAQQVDKLVHKMKEIDRGNLRIRPTMSPVSEFYMLDQTLCTMANNIDRLNDDIRNVQKLKEESERKYLQMQMNPHFLYNLLSVIRWIAFKDRHKDIIYIIDHLSDFYKIALSKGNDIIAVQDEIRLIKSYVELQNLSYSGSIRLSIRLDEALTDLQLCKMTLQPFVENSIVHGFVRGRELHIDIDISRFGQSGARIRIIDDGSGIEHDFVALIEGLNGADAKTSSTSFGITNTVARLKYLYGDTITIRAHRRDPGTYIEIVILNVG